jgi:hypothetical protein
VTVVGEAGVGVVLEVLVGSLRDTFAGTDAQLRKLISEALATAAEQVGLPTPCDGKWIARKFLESAAESGVSRLQVVGTALSGNADFEPSAISDRLRVAVNSELRDDLVSLGIKVDRVVDRFGPCLVAAVRAAATNSKSPLQAFASRLEADATYALLDNVAAAVGASREDVSTTLDMMEHEVERRILKRLDVLGVADHAVAANIVRSLELVPLPEREDVGLVGILAEGGSGKTTLAERVHLAAIEDARGDYQAPLPLFLEAISVGSITAEITRVWAEASDLATRGVDLVVDGLDEVGIDRGRALVGELRSLVNDPRSPIRRALVTARPLDFGLRNGETTPVSLLSEEQASAIVAMVS